MANSGTCSKCHGKHGIKPRTVTLRQREELEKRGHGEEIDWLMDRHKMYGESGPWCVGENTMPQSVDIYEMAQPSEERRK